LFIAPEQGFWLTKSSVIRILTDGSKFLAFSLASNFSLEVYLERAILSETLIGSSVEKLLWRDSTLDCSFRTSSSVFCRASRFLSTTEIRSSFLMKILRIFSYFKTLKAFSLVNLKLYTK